MSSVTYSFSSGTAITAAEMNQNFKETMALAEAVGVEQLTGGITYDKLADRNGVSWTTIPIVPFTTGTSYGSVGEFTMPTTMTTIINWQPILKSGVEGFLCGIYVHVVAQTTVSNSDPALDFWLNGTSGVKLGGSTMRLAADDTIYSIIQNDPLQNVLCSMSDGDYIQIRIGPHSGSGASTCRGVNAYFAMKYVLTA